VTKFCRGCGAPLTAENTSDAHVIPQALGGRLVVKDALCDTCNGVLNDLADLPLIEALGAWPTLFDVSRQNRDNPAKTVTTRKGYQVSVEADGTITRIDVVRKVTPIPQGQLVELGAGNMKTARQLVAWAEKHVPGFEKAEAEKYLKKTPLPDDDELNLRLEFGPQWVFGGVVAAVWLYLLHVTGQTFMDFDRLLSCIKKVQETGGTFRYLVDGLPGLNGPAIDFGHKLVARSVESTGELIVYVEVLGVFKIGGVYAKGSPGQSLESIYVYDLASKSERSNEFTIDKQSFDSQDWRKVGLGTGDAKALQAHFTAVLNALAEIYYRQRTSPAAMAQNPTTSDAC
jgi:HNH endonuclease